MQGMYSPPYLRYAYKLYSELIPMHNSKCFDNQKCMYPCPFESGYGRLVYPESHLCLESRLKINKHNRVTKHEKFVNFRYQNYETIHGQYSPEIGKHLTLLPLPSILTEKCVKVNPYCKLSRCSKNSYCVHCRFRSDRCICPLIDQQLNIDIRRGLDGPLNVFYWTFFCRKCNCRVRECSCIEAVTTNNDGTSANVVVKIKKNNLNTPCLKKPLPDKYVTWTECLCREHWLNCECSYMSIQQHQEYESLNEQCLVS